MDILNNILKDLDIRDENGLNDYISKNYGKDSKLKIYKALDLGVGNEDRIFGEKIKYEYAIIDVPKLDISNSSDISFQDCIFTGDVRIGNRERKPLSIFFNHVCINGELSISGSDYMNDVSLSSVIAKEIRFISSEAKKLSIYTSKTASLKLQNSNVEEFVSLSNEIGYFQKYQTTIEKINTSGDTFSISSQLKSDEKLKKHREELNVFEYPKEADYIKLSASEKRASISETLDFLFHSSSSSLNRKEQAEIKYLKGMNNIEGRFQRCLYWLFGGLIKPLFILALMFIVIAFFAVLYSNFGMYSAACLNGFESCPDRGLSFSEAVYYSGISFTTIGYGDIYPTSNIGYVAIIEGMLGVLLSSCLVVSLTRRYIE